MNEDFINSLPEDTREIVRNEFKKVQDDKNKLVDEKKQILESQTKKLEEFENFKKTYEEREKQQAEEMTKRRSEKLDSILEELSKGDEPTKNLLKAKLSFLDTSKFSLTDNDSVNQFKDTLYNVAGIKKETKVDTITDQFGRPEVKLNEFKDTVKTTDFWIDLRDKMVASGEILLNSTDYYEMTEKSKLYKQDKKNN